MASIYLIRHGQAGFNKLNYDQLSELGHLQAERVGQVLAARGFEAGRVFHGSMRRHQETMQGAHLHWHAFGPIVEHAGFNEFDSDEIIAKAFPEFKNKLVLGAWLATQKNRRKAFQTLFAKAVARWVSGQHDSDYSESWPAFSARVKTALQEVIAQSEGKNMVIFTSGGPISAIAQHCLNLSNDKTFELNWTLVNASLSQLLYSSQNPEKISLASFNEQQHLIGKYLTYR